MEEPEEPQELRHEGDPVYLKALWAVYLLAFLYLVFLFVKL